MNKIYKLIWSKVKNMWVAVAEIAKSHTKSPNSGVVGRIQLENNVNMQLRKGVSDACYPPVQFVPGAFFSTAVPAQVDNKDFKITVAAIVKNEAENVPTWVHAARSCADEIVVVDTGSTDDTIKRFADYGIKCFHYDWNDDFASAKNYMISLCHGDWIVLLDGDEWFREGCDVRKAIAKHHNNPVTKAIIADWICLDKDRGNAVMFSGGAVRAFRNQPDVRYFRKVHENLTIGYENFAFEPEFKMYHTGYSGSVNRSKHERNLRIMCTMFDFDNGKVEYPTDWRYIEDTYAGLGEFDKALWAADKMISYGVQEYSASAWVTKFNVLFAMKTPMEKMIKQFAYCFKTVPSVSGFRFLASIYYARNGRADLALDEYTEGVRMLMGPQDKVAMEHTFWRMYLPEASALIASVCMESNQLESALSALYVSEQYCGKTQWTDGVMVELRRRMAVLSKSPFDKVADKALPLLQFAKRGLVASAMVAGVTISILGNVNDAFAASYAVNSGKADGTNAIAIGGCAKGKYSITIGDDINTTYACGCYSIAFGGRATKDYAIGIRGEASGIGSIGIGGDAYYDSSVAVGYHSSITFKEGVAIGYLAGGSSTSTGGVALGSHSVVTTANTVSLGHTTSDQNVYDGTTYTSNLRRRIVNMANGTSATDGATVAQTSTTVAGNGITVTSGTNTNGSIKYTIAGKNMTAATASAAGTAGLVPAPAAGKQTSFLRGDGTWVVPTNTTYSAMKAATASCAGTAGLVPAPAAGKQTAFLRGDGTWVVPTDTNNKVTNTLGTTTKFYLTGTTSATTNTGGQTFDTGIYATTTAGQLYVGSLQSGGAITGTSITQSGSKVQLVTKDTGLTRGTAPSAAWNRWLIQGQDSAGKATGGLYKIVSTANVSGTYLYDYPNKDNTSGGHYIGIGHDANGNAVTYAPTPVAGNNSTQIATTAFTNTAITNAKNGTITGLSINGKTITYTKGDGSTGTITTQDNNTTYDALTVDELNTGTATTSRAITAKVLGDYVKGAVSDESSARTTAISSEQSARTSADTALGSRIDTLNTKVDTKTTVLEKKTKFLHVNAEETNADTIATGEDAVAVGKGTSVSGKDSVAMGTGSAVSGISSIAVGTGHQVTGNNSGTFGDPNIVNGDNSYVVGNNSSVASNVENAFVFGNCATITNGNNNDGTPYSTWNSTANGVIAMGNGVVVRPRPTYDGRGLTQSADGNNSVSHVVAIGDDVVAREAQTVGIGYGAEITGYKAVAIGAGATVNHEKSTVIGSASKTTGSLSTAVGSDAIAYGYRSVAIGAGAQALVEDASSYDSTSGKTRAVAIGAGSKAMANLSVAIGDNAVAERGKAWVVSIGANSYSGLLGSYASGYGAKSYGKNAVALGREAYTGQNTSGNIRSGAGSDATSVQNVGTNAVAVGYLAAATEDNAMAFGYKTEATGINAIALGSGTANTDKDFTNSITRASGRNSMAFGFNARAANQNSVAFGAFTEAYGERAVVFGTSGTDIVNDGNLDNARASGQGSIALGDRAVVDSNILSTSSTDTGSNDSIAIGTQARVRAKNAVALGGNASYTEGGTTVYANHDGRDGGALVGDQADGGVAIGGAVVESASASGVTVSHEAAAVMGKRGIAIGSGALVASKADYDTWEAVVNSAEYNTAKNEYEAAETAYLNKQTEVGQLQVIYDETDAADTEAKATALANLEAAQADLPELASTLATKQNYWNTQQNRALVLQQGEASGLADAIAIGSNANAGIHNSVAIGSNAKTGDLASDSIALGNTAVTGTNAENSIAIGGKALTGENADSSIAIGYDSQVTGEESIAIGLGHRVTGSHSGTFGDPNIVNGDNSYVVGNNSTVAENTDNVFVLGNNVTVNNGTAATDITVAEGVIALGNNASVSLDNKVASSRSSNSTGSPTVAHSVAIGDNAVVGEENAMALGYQAQAKALNSQSFGSNAQALSEGAAAIGHNAKVNENSSFATVVGYDAEATGEAANAFGYDATAGAQFATAFGRKATASAEAATAIGNDAKALSQQAVAIGGSALANGGANTNAVAIGRGATVGSDTQGYGETVAIGGGASVQNYYSTAVGSGASVTGQNSVALGQGAVASEANVVSVGKGTAGENIPATRRIVNVTDGTSATDAATVGQVRTVSEGNGIVLTETTNTNGSKNEAIAVKAGTNVTVDTNGVNVVGNGAVASADTGLISGGTAYSELRPIANGNYIATANTTAQNLGALDSALKTADNTAVKNITASGTTVTFTKGDGTTGTFTTQDNNTEYTAGNGLELIGTEFTAKAGANVTVDNNGINVAGNGTVADGNTGLVSGGTLFTEGRVSADGTYVRASNTIAGNLSALDTAVKTNADAIAQINTGLEGKANTSLDNITNDGKSVIKANAKEAINVVGSGKVTVDKTDVSGVDIYSVGVTVDGAVAEGNTGIVDGGTVYTALQAQKTTTDTALTGKANVALDNVTEAGHNVIKSDAKVAVNAVAGTHTTISKTDVDGVDTYAVNVTTDGTVTDGNTGIVTGGTVYTALNNEKTAREAADTTLQGNIDAEVTARGNEDTRLAGLITSEESARTAADTALSERIGALSADGEYILMTNDVSQNLGVLDTQVKANADNLADEVTARENADTALSERITTNTNNIATNTTDITNLKDLSNITDAGKTVIKDLAKGSVNVVGSGLASVTKTNVEGVDTYTVGVVADGEVADGNTKLVNGGTVHTAIQNAIGDLNTDIQASLNGKANIALDNVTDAGHAVIKSDAKVALNVVGGNYATVAKTDVNGVDTYTVNVATDGTVVDGNTKLVTGATVYNAIQDAKTEFDTKIADRTAYFSVNSTETPNRDGKGATGVDAMAIGDGASASGNSSAALGDYADAKGLRSIALGNSAGAEKDYGIAIGGLAKAKADGGIALGTSANVTGANGMALGNNAKAEGTTSYAIGQGANAKGESSVALGTSTEAAVTGVALGHAAKATGESGVALGTATNAEKTAVAIGHGANAGAEAAVALGVNASASQPTAVAIGLGSAATEANTVSFGNASTKRRIVNIAEGVADNDAVAMSQLKALQESSNDGLDTKANLTLDNIDDAGKTVVRDLAKGSVKVVNGTHTTVTEGIDGFAKTYAVNVTTDGEVVENNTGIVTGGTVYNAVHAEEESRKAADTALSDRIGTIDFDKNYVLKDNSVSDNLVVLDTQVKRNADDISDLKDMSNLTTAGETVIKNLSKGSVNVVGDGKASVVKTDVNGVDTYTVTVNADGTVADGNTNLVSGGTVYNAVHAEQVSRENADNALSERIGSVTADGNYISKSDTKSVSENLSALDTAIKTVADNASASIVANKTRFFGVNSTNEYDMNYDGGGAVGTNAIAVGPGAWADSNDSIAIGNMSATMFGEKAVAMGYGATALEENAVAVGPSAQAPNKFSTAVGSNAAAPGWSSTAIGKNALASGKNSIAVGSDSTATGEDEFSVGRPAVEANTELGIAAQPEVKRRITHVDTGINETDAVNYGQLTGLKDSLETSIANRTAYFSVNSTETPNRDGKGATGVDAMAIGDGASASGNSSAALGDYADAKGLRSIALGNSAGAEKDYGIAIGGLAKAKADGGIALGTSANVIGANGMALGNSAKAEGATSYAIGQGANAKGESSVALGTATESAVTGVAVGHSAKATGESGVAIGTATTAGKTAIALGHGANASVEASTAIGINSSATANHAVALGTGSVANEANTVSVGNAETKRRIVNVADATGDNDAVNLKQMNAVKNALEEADTAILDKIGTLASDGNYIGKDNTVSENLSVLDTQIKSNTDMLVVHTTDIANLKDLSNITDAGKEVIRTYAKGAMNITGSGKVTVTKTDVEGVDTYNVEVLANGAVADGNTDIVSGGTVHNALNAVKTELDTAIANSSAKYFGVKSVGGYESNEHGEGAMGDGSIAIGTSPMAMGENSIAIGPMSATMGKDSLAVGNGAVALDDSAIALGKNAQAPTAKSLAIGDTAVASGQNSVALGAGADTNNKSGAVAIGNGAVADAEMAVSFGKAATETDAEVVRRLMHVGNGVADSDAATMGQLKELDERLLQQLNSLGSNAVLYDATDKATVTFVGERGTLLTNVKSGAVTRTSMDAVNGSQLWGVKEDIKGFAADIKRNKDNISSLNNSVTAALESVSTSSLLVDTVNTTKADTSLNNLTAAGRQVINAAAANAVQEYMASQKANSNGTNSVDSGLWVANNNDAMAGRIADLSDGGSKGGNVLAKASSVSGMKLMSTGTSSDTNYVVYDDAEASQITLEGPVGTGTKVTGVAEGFVSAASTDAVNGAQLYATEQRLDTVESDVISHNVSIAKVEDELIHMETSHVTMESDVNTLKTQVETGFNVTVDGAKVKTVNPSDNVLDLSAGNGIQLENANGSVRFSVDTEAVGNALQDKFDAKADKDIVYTRIETDALVNVKADKNYVDNGLALKADKSYVDEGLAAKADIASVYTKTEADDMFVGKTAMDEALKNKANADASNVDVKSWSDKLGVGEVAEGNEGFVKGGAIYDAINRSAVVVADNESGALRVGGSHSYDSYDVVDVSKSDGSGRVITGIMTDPTNVSSAANVGYVNEIGQNIINGVNSGLRRVDDKINKVGAGAAALASLAPLPFDENQKWNISAAIGTYKGEQAGALGVFYKPADNVMLNVRAAIGNGENMGGAGVTLGLNKGAAKGLSKVAMAKAMNAQAAEIANQKQVIVDQQAQLESQKAEIAELRSMMQQVLKQTAKSKD